MLLLELLMAGAVAAAPQTSTPQTSAHKVVPLVQKTRIYVNGQAVILPGCNGPGLIQTANKAPSPEALRLGDLPKANFELTVNRTVDGCVKPAVVSYGVGK